MASSTTPTFQAEIIGEDFGIENISLTWALMSPIINKTFRVDLVTGTNTINFDLSTGDGKARMLIMIPPSTNTSVELSITGSVRISKNEFQVITLDQDAEVASIDIDASADLAGVRFIIL